MKLRSFRVQPDRYFHIGFFPMPEVCRIVIDGAPAFLHGLNALFVSDVHLRDCVSQDRLSAFGDLLRVQGADMLLLGGDYAESERSCERFFDLLRRIEFPLGKYAAPGNNDSPFADRIPQLADHADVTWLVNTSASVSLPGGTLEIGGCDEHKYGAPDTRALFGKNGYRILLSHFPVLPECDCELMLSGHTHAGQMAPFGITAYSLYFEKEYHLSAIKGLHRAENMLIFVGNGIGISKLPIRLCAAPQIYLLNFSNTHSDA